MQRHFIASVSVIGLMVAATAVLWMSHAKRANAHCQVPCGIYNDPARFVRLREDTATIAKAIGKINELAGKHEAQALNQAVRWVNTKEIHATHIIDVVTEYFLTQKVKPVARGAQGYDAYLKKLADHHAVMVAAMKTKQNADPALADALSRALDGLAGYYTR